MKKMSFPREYNTYYYTNKSGNKVTVVTTRYKGKICRGVAVCSKNDKYNKDVGDAIARARCDIKFLDEKAKYADKAVASAMALVEEAKKKVDKAAEFYNDTKSQRDKAFEIYDALMTEFS